MSFLITLVRNKGRQSLPLVMLLPCSINNFQSVAFPEFFPDAGQEILWGLRSDSARGSRQRRERDVRWPV